MTYETTTRSPVRVAGVYATRWRFREPRQKSKTGRDANQTGQPAPNPFAGTRFEAFGKVFKDQLRRLPKLIAPMADVTSTFRIESRDLSVQSAEVYLFALPSDQVVASLVIDCMPAASVTDHPDRFDAMLDDFTDEKFTIEGKALSAFLKGMAPPGRVENLTNPSPGPAKGWLRRAWAWLRGRRAPGSGSAELHDDLPEQHEIVYLRAGERLTEVSIEDLLYRRKAPHQKEFSRQHRVPELTDQGAKLGIVSTRASLIKGHDPLVEDSVLLSAVQAVGTLARFRDIWDRAFELVNKFRNDKLASETGVQQRDDLEKLVDELGNLEFDLTFSVEFPLMRVETYHRALSRALDVPRQAKRLSEMFAQIGGSVRSEITAIDIRDSRKNELRMRRNEAATLVFASIGVPLGALLAFFGINATEVRKDFSMFDKVYRPEYLVAAALVFVPSVVVLFSSLFARSKRRWERARARKRLQGRTG